MNLDDDEAYRLRQLPDTTVAGCSLYMVGTKRDRDNVLKALLNTLRAQERAFEKKDKEPEDYTRKLFELIKAKERVVALARDVELMFDASAEHAKRGKYNSDCVEKTQKLRKLTAAARRRLSEACAELRKQLDLPDPSKLEGTDQ